MNENTFPSLKDYVIEKKLGVGTYASVYKARSKTVISFIPFIISLIYLDKIFLLSG